MATGGGRAGRNGIVKERRKRGRRRERVIGRPRPWF
jgi:hypothetical protein